MIARVVILMLLFGLLGAGAGPAYLSAQENSMSCCQGMLKSASSCPMCAETGAAGQACCHLIPSINLIFASPDRVLFPPLLAPDYAVWVDSFSGRTERPLLPPPKLG